MEKSIKPEPIWIQGGWKTEQEMKDWVKQSKIKLAKENGTK